MKRETVNDFHWLCFCTKSLIFTFVLLALGFMFLYGLQEVKIAKWAKMEFALCDASEQQMNDILQEYDNISKKNYALNCVINTRLRNNIMLHDRNVRGAYHVVILGLTNDKSSSEIIRRMISDFFCEYANCEYRNFSYDDRLTSMPVPLREYIWSLLLLEGEDGCYWLRQELAKYPDISGAKTILDFACTICWVRNAEKKVDLLYNNSYTISYFDNNWIQRYLLRLQEDGFDVGEENLMETLKQLASPSDFQNDSQSLYATWRTKSAVMVLRAMTANKQYRKIFPYPTR